MILWERWTRNKNHTFKSILLGDLPSCAFLIIAMGMGLGASGSSLAMVINVVFDVQKMQGEKGWERKLWTRGRRDRTVGVCVGKISARSIRNQNISLQRRCQRPSTAGCAVLRYWFNFAELTVTFKHSSGWNVMVSPSSREKIQRFGRITWYVEPVSSRHFVLCMYGTS